MQKYSNLITSYAYVQVDAILKTRAQKSIRVTEERSEDSTWKGEPGGVLTFFIAYGTFNRFKGIFDIAC